MSSHLLQQTSVLNSQKKSNNPNFYVGSILSVHYKIIEGTKSRVQIFSGIVTNRHGGHNIDATFTVLKNSLAAIKVSRVFPLHSPSIERIEVLALKRSRRANIKQTGMKLKDAVKEIRSKTMSV